LSLPRGAGRIWGTAAAAAALVLLFGAADARALTGTPSSFTFAKRAIGSTSPPQSLTLTACPAMGGCTVSTVSGTFYMGHMALCPAQSGAFAQECVPSTDFIQTNECPSGGMPPGSSCTMQIRFRPDRAGLRLATVHIGYDTIAHPLAQPAGPEVLLSGTAVKPKRKRCGSKQKRRSLAAKKTRCRAKRSGPGRQLRAPRSS
jgi:hypothetical protein